LRFVATFIGSIIRTLRLKYKNPRRTMRQGSYEERRVANLSK
jgi:hypothetical protein